MYIYFKFDKILKSCNKREKKRDVKTLNFFFYNFIFLEIRSNHKNNININKNNSYDMTTKLLAYSSYRQLLSNTNNQINNN